MNNNIDIESPISPENTEEPTPVIKVEGQRSYELTILCYNQYNEEVIKGSIQEIFNSYDQSVYQIEKIEDIVRYDIIHNKKQIKINMVTIYFTMLPAMVKKLSFYVFKQNKIILKHMIVAEKRYIQTNIFDYKKPINMKKHIFESQRIMPRELNNLNKKQQRILAQNIKRCRVLGLFGHANKTIKQ